MSESVTKSAILLLEDGNIFYGAPFGKIGTAAGEICFNTGMTGYQEVFTDPSYFGQIVIMNSAHIGNYGVKTSDVESNSAKIKGLIGRNLEERYSRIQADGSLPKYLQDQNVVAITGLDTRALVSHIRDVGAMNCVISSETDDINVLKEKLKETPSMKGLELASVVSTKEVYELGNPHAQLRVAVYDYGVKKSILHCMTERGAFVRVYPAKTPFGEIADFNPNGYFLSNGPGDPDPMDYAVETVKKILEQGKPMFGICLGHQVLAMANGIPSFKMHHGHRGLNHPVKNVLTGRSEITTQNHGFGIDPEAVKKSKEIEVTHVNLNDDSIEGIRMKSKPAFSVQYHPEATPGSFDSRYLFDDFIELLKKH